MTVTDPLPTNISFVSATPQGTCSAAGQTVTCNLGTVNAGQTVPIDLQVSVASAAGGTAPQNTATVSSATLDPNPNGATSATASIGVGQVANLAIAKSVSPQTANVGDTVSYTLTASNDIPTVEGAVPAPSALGTTGGVVTDILPPGLQFVSSPNNICTAAGQTVTCNLGAVAQGSPVTATYTVLVTSAAAGQSVTNQATIASEAVSGFPKLPDINPNDSTDSATLNVNPVADLSLTKTASNTNAAVDDEVDYTLTASNAGPDDATGVTISDPLPAGLDFIDATPGCDNVMGTVTCDLGTVPSGGTASVTVRTHTTAAVAGTAVTNLATVSSDDLDPNPNNNQASATVDVQPLVDLELTKVASNPAPPVGGQVSYTLSLVNSGPSPATGVTITDPLPSGLRFVSATSGQGSCGASGQTVVCHLGTLAAGGAALVSITADVAPSTAGTTVQNTATASADEPIAQPELLSSHASIRPVPEAPPGPLRRAELKIEKTVNHKTAAFGLELKYTITVSNAGPATAETPTVTDAFSADASIVSVHPSSGSCNRRRPFECRLGSIAPGGRATITIVARGEALGKLRNTASVSTPTPLASGSHTLATATTTIVPGPHSRIALSDTTSTPMIPAGGTATFMLKVSNPNPWPMQNVKVCDTLPLRVLYAAASLGVKHTGRVVCWTIKTLRPHASKYMWVSVEPLLGVSGTLRDGATANATAGGRRLSAHAHAQVTVAPSTVCGSAPDVPSAHSRPGPVAVAAC